MGKSKNISLEDSVVREDYMKRIFEENNREFFSYAWRDNVKNFLKSESKYCRLVEWINQRLEQEFTLLNIFNPADKDSDYSYKKLKQYLEGCQNVGVLLNAKSIILSDYCTTKMRDNWEYTICKLFKIRYDKELGYVRNLEKPQNKPYNAQFDTRSIKYPRNDNSREIGGKK